MCGQTSCCVTIQLLTLKEQVRELKAQVEEGKRWKAAYNSEKRICASWKSIATAAQDRADTERQRRVKAVEALKTLITELKEQPNVD